MVHPPVRWIIQSAAKASGFFSSSRRANSSLSPMCKYFRQIHVRDSHATKKNSDLRVSKTRNDFQGKLMSPSVSSHPQDIYTSLLHQPTTLIC